ncbi:hypothetical protein QOZ96_002311 [Brevundimonas nasdae]|jgi:hypothetical protein|nr:MULTISPECIES: hypothetical protein [Brevundimonas]MDQ0452358.1 hypothetical protein [Brevundimonas nasdae]
MTTQTRIKLIAFGSARALTQQDVEGMFIELSGRPSKTPAA